MNWTSTLRKKWRESQSFDILLRSIDISAANVIQKNPSNTIPPFAASLGTLLEPIKANPATTMAGSDSKLNQQIIPSQAPKAIAAEAHKSISSNSISNPSSGKSIANDKQNGLQIASNSKSTDKSTAKNGTVSGAAGTSSGKPKEDPTDQILRELPIISFMRSQVLLFPNTRPK